MRTEVEQQAAEITEIKSRMMRDNLIIRSKDKKYAATKGENTAVKVKTFMKDELKVDVEDMKITRAHRMGKSTANNNAMMIAKFPYASDQKKIFGNIKAIAGTDYSISKQYPTEVEERRHFAWATYKKEKAAGKDVRFDPTGHLYVNDILQDKFDHKPLPPVTPASYGAGAPVLESSKSDIHFSGEHAFQTFVFKVKSREDVAAARDLLFSDVETLERATYLPYAYRLSGGLENFDSDKDYYSGTSILSSMKKLKLEDTVAFILHLAPPGKPITMSSKRDIIENALGDAMIQLNRVPE